MQIDRAVICSIRTAYQEHLHIAISNRIWTRPRPFLRRPWSPTAPTWSLSSTMSASPFRSRRSRCHFMVPWKERKVDDAREGEGERDINTSPSSALVSIYSSSQHSNTLTKQPTVNIQPLPPLHLHSTQQLFKQTPSPNNQDAVLHRHRCHCLFRRRCPGPSCHVRVPGSGSS